MFQNSNSNTKKIQSLMYKLTVWLMFHCVILILFAEAKACLRRTQVRRNLLSIKSIEMEGVNVYILFIFSKI
jgi:hypothetical protein